MESEDGETASTAEWSLRRSSTETRHCGPPVKAFPCSISISLDGMGSQREKPLWRALHGNGKAAKTLRDRAVQESDRKDEKIFPKEREDDRKSPSLGNVCKNIPLTCTRLFLTEQQI